MQKTQLTVLIAECDMLKPSPHTEIDAWEAGYMKAIETIKRKAISLLPKEKEDIEKAYKAGLTSNDVIGSQEVIYFNQTFTQYKP